MKLLACQIHCQGIKTKSAKTNHIEKISEKLRDISKKEEADLIVLPELSSIEYSTDAFNNLKELAEPLDGETFCKISKLAKDLNCAITYGFPRVEMGNYFISHLVIDKEGKYLTHYDKVHIAQFGASEEKPFFERGNKLGVFSIGGISIGIIICYDFRFPEYIRHLTRNYDLDLILHPSAFTRDNSFESWHHFVITRALENQVFFLSINRAGKDWGHSIFCPPWIDGNENAVVFGEDEEFKVFDISKKRINESRETYPFYADKLKHYEYLKP